MRSRRLARAMGLLLGLVVTLALVGSASAASLVDNGDFEEPVVPDGFDSHQVFNAGDSFGAWTVAAGTMLLAHTYTDDAPNGRQYALFNRDPSGALGPATFEQDLATSPSTRYHLRFAYAGEHAVAGQPGCGESDRVKRFGVLWGGDPMVEFEFDTTESTPGDYGWTYADMLVDAPTASTSLKFRSLHEGNCGATLDDVSVDVPPASMTGTSLVTSPSSSVYGQPVELTATVIGVQPGVAPAGSVQFKRDGVALGGPVALDVNGEASLTTGGLAPGRRSLTAEYQPTGPTLDPSRAGVRHVVAKAATTTTTSVDPSTIFAGQAATFTAVVTPTAPGAGQPTGAVQFIDDLSGALVGEPMPVDGDGRARLTTAPPAGSQRFRAHYAGDGNFEASDAGAATLQVKRARTATEIVSDSNPVAPGGEVAFTVTVTTLDSAGRGPRGVVTFSADGQVITEPIPFDAAGARSGQLTVVFDAPTEPGTTTIGAVYSGDEHTEPSGAELRQTVAAAPPPSPSSPQAPAAPATGAASGNHRSELAALLQGLAKAFKRRGAAALKGKLRFGAPKGGVLELRVFSRARGRARKRLLASGSSAFVSEGAVVLRLRPTAAGRRALRSGRRIAVQVVAQYSPLLEFTVSVTKRMTIPARAKRSKAPGARPSAGGWRARA